MTGAKYTLEFFKNAGVKHAFGIPGHGNVSIFDALSELNPDLPAHSCEA